MTYKIHVHLLWIMFFGKVVYTFLSQAYFLKKIYQS
jgi:hypothetical protein